MQSIRQSRSFNMRNRTQVENNLASLRTERLRDKSLERPLRHWELRIGPTPGEKHQYTA